MINRLFVYGSLGPDRPNEHVLQRIGGTWEKARVKGTLHPKGWGVQIGYPGITLDETADKVEGFVFHSDAIPQHWIELDDFEGQAYERVLTTVELENNETLKAYIYALKP